jgi:hypothetical protein
MEMTFTYSPDGLKTIEHFEVTVTRCNLVQETVHATHDVSEATQEYADLLAEALVPPSTDMKHVRVIQLFGKDSNGEIIVVCAAGPFPCNHLTTGKEPGHDEKEDDE